MSARQPFYSAQRASESQGTAQSFNPKPFLIDPTNPLHLGGSSSAANQSESRKIAFSVPDPFSSNGVTSASQATTPGLARKQSGHTLSQSVERDQTGSLNSVGFTDLGNIRPGTTAPRLETNRDRPTALEVQHGFVYQKTSRRSLGLLDPGSIVRPGTTVPQSKALHDYAAGLDIKAPIPKHTTLSASAFLSNTGIFFYLLLLSLVELRAPTTFSDRILENDAHISTTETRQGVSHKVDDMGDLTIHSSTKFHDPGPQRVPIEQFGRYNTSDVEASHEITAEGRVKMTAFRQAKKRNRDEIEDGDEDESYQVKNQAKRHKSRHRKEFETVSLIYHSSSLHQIYIYDIQRGHENSPRFSPRPEKTSFSHTEGDVLLHFPHARGSTGSPHYRERQTTSPVNERNMPPDESLQTEQPPDARRNAFEKLLGRNTDAFARQNMEKYDALVKKWSECSEEEWIAGAEGFFLHNSRNILLDDLACYLFLVIAGKYEKIVTYVR